MITIDDFKKVALIVAEIKKVAAHPNADKLYVLTVNTGSQEKQLVAGIRAFYSPEELAGRKIIMVDNIQPVSIRGQESQGMLLAAQGEGGTSILMPDKDVPAGSSIR